MDNYLEVEVEVEVEMLGWSNRLQVDSRGKS